MAFIRLFLVNFKMLYRNWRGLFFTVVLPVALFIVLAMLKIKIGNFLPVGTSYARYLLPGMIALTMLQTGMFNLAYFMVDLREKGILKRFQVTPISNFDLLGSLVASRLVVMFIQVILLTTIGQMFFHTAFTGNFVALILLLVLGGASFLSIGFTISNLVHSYEEASPITTMINLLFSFLGNIFFPTAILPFALRIVGEYLPITFLAQGLRENYLGHPSLSSNLMNILGLAVWTVLLFWLGMYTYRKTAKS